MNKEPRESERKMKSHPKELPPLPRSVPPMIVAGGVFLLIVVVMVALASGGGDKDEPERARGGTTSAPTAAISASAPTAAISASAATGAISASAAKAPRFAWAPTAPRSAPAPAAPRSAPAPAAPVLTGRDGKFEFTVTGVETRQGALGGLSDPPMGEWFIVSVTVSNIGDQERTLYATNQNLIDSQGREFESEFWAAAALNDESSVDLNPGFTIEYKIPFDVSPGTVPTAIELHDSMFSGGVTLALG